jgi:hypothetical protein
MAEVRFSFTNVELQPEAVFRALTDSLPDPAPPEQHAEALRQAHGMVKDLVAILAPQQPARAIAAAFQDMANREPHPNNESEVEPFAIATTQLLLLVSSSSGPLQPLAEATTS